MRPVLMKNLLKNVAAIALLVSPLAVSAQKMTAAKVPATVTEAFAKAYPKASNAKWEKEDGKYEVAFKNDGKKYEISYSDAGTMLEMEQKISTKALPASVIATLAKDFVGYKVEEAEMAIKDGVTTYEMYAEKGKEEYELVFDASGKLIKKEVKEEEGKEKYKAKK